MTTTEGKKYGKKHNILGREKEEQISAGEAVKKKRKAKTSKRETGGEK